MMSKLFKLALKSEYKNRQLVRTGIYFFVVFIVAGFSHAYGNSKEYFDEIDLTENAGTMLQEIRVSGTVTDQNTGETLPGVSVQIRGTSIGTVTDVNGGYTIEVTNPTQFLVFSFVGYAQQSIQVGDQRLINVRLVPSAVDLDEIVVIGYGTQRRGDITGSVSTVGREDFRSGSVRDAAHLIQGRAPGLTVGLISGDPTAGANVSLRGVSSLLGDSQPLVIIDGVPGDLRSVAPEDIESVNILKDGAAAAIYGTRGTDGVILITTRKADKDATSLEYSTYFGTQSISKRLEFLSASDMRQKIAEGYKFHDYGYDTDWLSEMSNKMPIQQNHHLFLQGGMGESSYSVSLGYKDWDGYFLKSDNEELRLRFAVNHSMFDGKLRMNANLITNQQNYHGGEDWGGSFRTYTFAEALLYNPTNRVRNADGTWQQDAQAEATNPVASLMEGTGQVTNRGMRLSGNLIFQPVEGLNVNLLLSNNNNRGRYDYERTFQHASTVIGNERGYAAQGNNSREEKLLELTANYEFAVGDHKFVALGGYSWQESVWSETNVNNWLFPISVPLPSNIGLGEAYKQGAGRLHTSKASSRLIGFFGRANYNYNNRYMVMGSIRREGSSRFGSDNRWGTFPSLSAGWRVSEESFMKNSAASDIFDNLMLRVGYGVTGIEPMSPYLALTMLNFGARGYYEGNWIFGLEPVQNPNPNLRWEQQGEVNVGLEFSMFNYRLGFELDVYQRNTKDLLWNFAVPVPPYLFNTMLINVGELESKGFEALVKMVPVKKQDFQWKTDIGYATNKSRMVSLSTEEFQSKTDFFYTGVEGHAQLRDGTHRVEVGELIGNFWTWKTIDIDENGYWIIQGADGNPKPFSQAKQEDKMVVGNGIPDFYINWNHQFSYKQFDLAVNMRGAFGFQVFNHTFMRVENSNITGHNVPKSTYDKVYGKAVLKDAPNFLSYYIEDGDYWKIDNISLGYNFNTSRIEYLRNARVFVSAQNAITITGYRGIDPEVRHIGLDPGKDSMGKYPTMKSFIIGANFLIR
jgi:TonB-dependent starch-binding outer membrane protein SusC